MAQRAKKPVVRVPDVHLAGLRSATRAEFEGDSDHDGLEFAQLELEEFVGGSHRFVECRIEVGRFGHVRLRRARFNTCEFDELEASTLDVAESDWSDVVVRGGRFGALAAPGARLTRVAIRTVRANYVNLRGAEITDLELTDCRIEELDLGAAQIRRADLTGCDIDRLVLSEAVLKDVDLRGAELSTLEGVAALRGATISPFQLTRLAPAFAERLGILVAE